jgi:hypothetical protein
MLHRLCFSSINQIAVENIDLLQEASVCVFLIRCAGAGRHTPRLAEDASLKAVHLHGVKRPSERPFPLRGYDSQGILPLCNEGRDLSGWGP